MSALLGEWIRTLTGAALFCAIALTLCPKGRARQVLSLACACVMALALISPVVTADGGGLSRYFAGYNEAARTVIEDAEAAAGQYQRRVIERECEAYISDRADALGIALGSVSVTARWSEKGFWYPWECSLDGAYSDDLADSITGELGIDRERQNWEVSG